MVCRMSLSGRRRCIDTLNELAACPLYLRSLPNWCIAANHVECQQRSFDHFVGNRDQRGRHAEAEHSGSLGVDYEFEPGRLHDRQVRRFGALEDAARIKPA
jgi:hypothetical protein